MVAVEVGSKNVGRRCVGMGVAGGEPLLKRP